MPSKKPPAKTQGQRAAARQSAKMNDPAVAQMAAQSRASRPPNSKGAYIPGSSTVRQGAVYKGTARKKK
jgi:hypothetical protein